MARRFKRSFRGLIPQAPQGSHWRQSGKSITKALYPAPFVINGDKQRWRAERVDFPGQFGELLRIGVISGEQDDAADQRVTKALALEVGYLTSSGKASRIGFKTLNDGRKVRFAKKSGEVIDV